MKPVEIEILLKDRVSTGLELMQGKLDGLLDKAASSSERVRILEAAIKALNAQLAAMKKAGEAADGAIDQSKNAAAIDKVEAKVKELTEQMRKLGETAENTSAVPSGVTQASRQYNGLHMSVQQIARELPAATMGLNMFFLAISNNLPILTDEIKRAKAANEELKASGQSTVPVWRQLVSSIFSWQTALMVAITVLSMYGKEIVSWIGGLFKSKDALEASRLEQERLNKSMADARSSAAKEAASLRVLYAMTQNAGASMKERTAAVRELQSQYPAYFGNLSQEAILAGNASAAYRQLTQDIMSAAYARAYQERMEDLASKNVEELRGSQADYNWMQRNRAAYDAAKAYMDSAQSAEDRRDYQRSRAGWTYDAEAVERYENALRTLDEYEERRSRWQRHNEAYKRNVAVMADYEEEILKRQPAVAKTTQGQSYEQDRKDAEREARERLKEGKRLAKERQKAQVDADKALLALQQKNQDDDIALMREGTAKKLAEIDNDYEKRIAEIERQETEFKKKNQEAGLQSLGADGLTKQQQNALQKATDNAAKERERQIQEVYLAEAQAMRDYLKEYGTFQQQKLAIAQEYADKISKAQTEGERMRLTAERDRAVQQVEINTIKQNIDWGSVFGDFGTMFRDQLQPTIDRLRQIANSDTFRQSSLDEQQVLYELIEKLENANAAWDGDIFKRVSDDIMAYQAAMRNYTNAVEKARIAEKKLADAQSTLDAAKRGGLSQEIITAAQAAVDEAQEAFNAASEEVTNFGAQVQETTTSLNSSATEAKAMFEGLAEGLRGLSSGSLQGIGQGVMSLDNLALFGKKGEVTQKAGNVLAKGFQSLLGKDSQAAKTLSAALGDSGLAGEIISAILGMLDMLAEGGIGGIASNLSDTLLGSINGILDDIFSGGIITKPLQSLVDGVGGILDTVTFGGFSSWGNNAAETRETIERLTTRNDALIDSLDRLNDTMKEANGAAESVAAAEQAKKYQEEVNENYRDIAAARAGYQGKHHSWSKYFNDWLGNVMRFEGLDSVEGNKAAALLGVSDKDLETWRKMNDIAGFKVTSRSDFLSITPEQMAEMLADVDIRELIESIGKGGYGAKMLDTLEDYADQAGKIEEIDNSLRETLTKISFDSMYDSFIDTLMDMDASAEDFADDFSEYMMRAILSDQIGTMFKDRLQEWYTAFADAMEDGDLASGELDSLREGWDKIVAEAMAERDKLAEAMGYKGSPSAGGSSQTGKPGTYTAMSQEQGTKLEGLWTTSAMHLSSIDAKMTDVSEQMGTAVDHLRRIEENTGASAKHLGEIKADIKTMLRDGVKVK